MNTFMDFQEDSSCVFLASITSITSIFGQYYQYYQYYLKSAVASNVLVDETGSYIWAGSDTNVLIVNVNYSNSSSSGAKKRSISESFERISSP